jgi:hypothetical protein
MRTFPFVGALALLLSVAPVQAGPWPKDLPRKLKLEYKRAPSAARCPTEQTFRDTVGASMSFDPFDPEAKARLVVSLRKEGATFKGKAEILDEAGKALWSYPVAVSNCFLVTDALGFAVGIALDPIDGRKQPEPPPPPPAPPPPALPPPPPALPIVRPAKPDVELGFGTALALGKVPSVAAPELVVEGAVRWKILSVGLEARWIPPIDSERVVDGIALGQWSTTRLSGGLVPCVRYLWFFGCGLGQIAGLFGSGVEVPDPLSGRAFSAALGGRLGAALALPNRFGLRFAADLLATLYGTQVGLNLKPYWEPSPVEGAVGVGLVRTF